MELVFGLLLAGAPFYFTYFFRKEKIYSKLGLLKTLLILGLMMYLTALGFEKVFNFFEWNYEGLVLLIIFSCAAHLVVSATPSSGKCEWDKNNGDSW